MNTPIFKKSNDGLTESLKYYNQIREEAENLYNFYKKYHEYTQDYCTKLRSIINSKENYNDKKEKNNINENPEKTIIDVKNNFNPFNNYSKIINNIYNEKIENEEPFLQKLGDILKNLKNKIDDAKASISQIEKEVSNNKRVFLFKYSNYENTMRKVYEILYNTEKDLVAQYMKKKKEKVDDSELKQKLMNKITDNIKNHNYYINELDKNKQFIDDLLRKTNDHIETIKKNITNLIVAMGNVVNIAAKEKGINSQQIEINVEISEIEKIINEKIKTISNEQGKIKPLVYNLKILENKNYFNNTKQDKPIRTVSIKMTKNISQKTNEENELTDEDIFKIVNIMFSFSSVNQDKYSIEVESNKIKLRKIIENILCGKIYDKENQDLKNLINNDKNKDEYLLTLLIALNNSRNKEKSELSKTVFDILNTMFNSISDNLFSYLKKENDLSDIYMEHADLILILSQTIYFLENSKKVYLLKGLKNHDLFKTMKFWEKYIKFYIEGEIKKISQYNLTEKIKKSKIENIVMAQLVSDILYMKDFELEVENINNIICPILEYYDISQETKERIKNRIYN